MRGRLNDREARCPFFTAHTKDCIICESPLPACSAWNKYRREREKDRQYKIFCCGRYENCEMYRAVMEKYEEE